MSSQSSTVNISFDPINNARLANLCGPCNENLQQIEDHFNVTIYQHSNVFYIDGPQQVAMRAKQCLDKLYQATANETLLNPEKIFRILSSGEKSMMSDLVIRTRHKVIKPLNTHQHDYLNNIKHHDINFAIGPAGTGKTYLAVACAVQALEQGDVERLIFVRPAVEAGEKLGFLPGDIEEKVLPYLRPIYDALYEMLGFNDAQKLINKDIIEIAPLAFMRGRTLNDAFIILDEAQNTTEAQMQMFLTRLGFGSTAVITGDITQIDLPHGSRSGLNHAVEVIKNIDRISITRFSAKDAVRHPLVNEIIRAYDRGDEE